VDGSSYTDPNPIIGRTAGGTTDVEFFAEFSAWSGSCNPAAAAATTTRQVQRSDCPRLRTTSGVRARTFPYQGRRHETAPPGDKGSEGPGSRDPDPSSRLADGRRAGQYRKVGGFSQDGTAARGTLARAVGRLRAACGHTHSGVGGRGRSAPAPALRRTSGGPRMDQISVRRIQRHQRNIIIPGRCSP
jgi:hypothetical protein